VEAHPNNNTSLDSPATGTDVLFSLTVTAAAKSTGARHLSTLLEDQAIGHTLASQ
jgi:hypothetical protein